MANNLNGGELIDESKEEVIKWIDEVLILDLHGYTCQENTNIIELKQYLVNQLFKD